MHLCCFLWVILWVKWGTFLRCILSSVWNNLLPLKHYSLPLSPQNYPLHGSEVNGFHSAPTTYSHTPAINGESIMGKKLNELVLYNVEIAAVIIVFPPRIDEWLSCDSSLTVSAANRGTTAGSSGDEIGKALASVSSSKLWYTHKKYIPYILSEQQQTLKCYDNLL